jgi:hypothetical protein
MGAPAIFEKQIEIKLLHSASTEGVTDSGSTLRLIAADLPISSIFIGNVFVSVKKRMFCQSIEFNGN